MPPTFTLDPAITEAEARDALAIEPTPYELVLEAMADQAQDDLFELGAGAFEPATPREAVRNGRELSRESTYVGVGYCLRTVRGPIFEVPALWPDAETAWEEADGQHRTADPMAIPFGAVPYWLNGGFGHVAVSVGGGLCLTTDYRRPGYVDLAPIAALGPWCRGKLVGWAEELNGVDVWPNRERPRFDLDDRIVLVRNALRRARDNKAPAHRIEGLEKWLEQLRNRKQKETDK